MSLVILLLSIVSLIVAFSAVVLAIISIRLTKQNRWLIDGVYEAKDAELEAEQEASEDLVRQLGGEEYLNNMPDSQSS